MASELHDDKDLKPEWKRREDNHELLVISHSIVFSSAINSLQPLMAFTTRKASVCRKRVTIIMEVVDKQVTGELQVLNWTDDKSNATVTVVPISTNKVL